MLLGATTQFRGCLGYGLSTGKPSEKNCYADIDAAYEYLTGEAGIKPDSIILMGRSVGSGPSVDLASRRQVGGLILVCPITSCVRVMKKVQTTPTYDMFANIDKIHRVRCHVLVVHGKKDSTVSIDHGIQLCRKARCSAPPLWQDGANHNDLETDYKMVILARYKDFLHKLEDDKPQTAEEKLSSIMKLKRKNICFQSTPADWAVAVHAELDSGVIAIHAFESQGNLHIMMDSSNAYNPSLSQLKEKAALIIAHRFLLAIEELTGGEVPVAVDPMGKLNAYEYGVVVPAQDEMQFGSWAYLQVPNNVPGPALGPWIAGVILFWLLSGQEAFVGKGGVDSACTGEPQKDRFAPTSNTRRT